VTAAFGSDPHREEPREHDGPIVRDRRRIDPVTGQVREPQQAAAPDTGDDETAATSGAAGNGEDAGRQEADGRGAAADLEKALSERTADLQRLQAEYVNYKRRVDRDRDLVKENATYAALAPITEVMDTIDRAREHGELEGGFKAVADQLERILAGRGLVKFGEVGDAFDPAIHDALSHIGEDPDVAVTTCKVIAKAGYKIGDRVVRAAQVLVVDPASGPIEDVGGGTIDPDADSAAAAEPEVGDDGE
jgi:molecular chaperone GrpE